jgi:hypothetical protein
MSYFNFAWVPWDINDSILVYLPSLQVAKTNLQLVPYTLRARQVNYEPWVSVGVLIILTCSWELSWITKDAAQPDRVEGFLKAPVAATLWLMSDHGAHLRYI